jgi:hypothetical protein
MAYTQENWPPLHPDEKTMLEDYAGKKLTEEEAHRMLRDAKIEGAFNRWLEEWGVKP